MLVHELKLLPAVASLLLLQNLLQHVSNIANSGRNPHQQEQNGENDGDQNNGGKDNQGNLEDNREV
jgi:hypothetical protein